VSERTAEEWKRFWSDLRDSIRGWRDNVGDQLRLVDQIQDNMPTVLKMLESGDQQGAIDQIKSMSNVLGEVRDNMLGVGNDMYHSARGDVSDYYPPKIVRRVI
jgi:hypothetical protein